ncbi:shootin-1-like isoform X2 [Varanus komodoensis]|uniref:shootin-1-like isoform X2 n=1 Tax=Varanus komodoensis TaxID=61221 RepID=UPI001CF7D536|nr:shootin-1-like isoform X2 [Varanus komodoensis]
MELSEGGFGQLEAILESNSSPDSEEEEEDQEAALLQEREEVEEKLQEYEQASQAVLAELSLLEAEYEIEKTCREQAEAYAAQVSAENHKLKRISVAFAARALLPGDLLGRGEAEEPTAEAAEGPVDPYVQLVKALQGKISQLLGEKEELSMRVRQLQEQLEEERSEKQALQGLVRRGQEAVRNFKEAVRLVTKEYGKVSQQLGLEEELRQQAEVFARQMLVKQEEANRQSTILMQNVGPDLQLLRALDEVATATRALEEAKQAHQEKVKDLEAQLAERPQREELCRLQAALAAAEEEKACLEERLLQLEERKAALEQRVKSLEEKAKVTEEAPAPKEAPLPPPPPPPPLPPPTCTAHVDPLTAIRQRKGVRPVKQGASKPGLDEVKARAVDEMIARIKSGVALRPVGSKRSSAASTKRRSAALELQSLLSTKTGLARRPTRQRRSQKNNLASNQLASILQRRRRIVDCPAEAQAPQKPSATATGCQPATDAQGTEVGGARCSPEPEPVRKPHAHLQSSTSPGTCLPGDPDRPAAEGPPHPGEKRCAVSGPQKRAASLQLLHLMQKACAC